MIILAFSGQFFLIKTKVHRRILDMPLHWLKTNELKNYTFYFLGGEDWTLKCYCLETQDKTRVLRHLKEISALLKVQTNLDNQELSTR